MAVPAEPGEAHLRPVAHRLHHPTRRRALAARARRRQGGPTRNAFVLPVAVATGADGRIAVADMGRRCVHLYLPAERRYVRLYRLRTGRRSSRRSAWPSTSSRRSLRHRLGRQGLRASVRDGELRFVLREAGAEPLQRPTGIAYSPQRKLLYVVDTLANRVHAFRHDRRAGVLVRRARERARAASTSRPTSSARRPGELYVTDALNFRIAHLRRGRQAARLLRPSRRRLGRPGDAEGGRGRPRRRRLRRRQPLRQRPALRPARATSCSPSAAAAPLRRVLASVGRLHQRSDELYVCDTYNRRCRSSAITEGYVDRQARPERGALRRGLLAAAPRRPRVHRGAQVPVRPDRADMPDTKHNLSVSGPGPIRALDRDPHLHLLPHAAQRRRPTRRSGTGSSSRRSTPSTPARRCRRARCRSPRARPSSASAVTTARSPWARCSTRRAASRMAGSGTLPPASLSNFGLDLSRASSGVVPVPRLRCPTPSWRRRRPAISSSAGRTSSTASPVTIRTTTRYGKFLVKDNRYSALCITCHQIDRLGGSAHATSTASVVGILPRPPKTGRPTRSSTSGDARPATRRTSRRPREQLLNFTDEPPEPFSCTSGGVTAPSRRRHTPRGRGRGSSGCASRAAMVDIGRQVGKAFRAPPEPIASARSRRRAGRRAARRHPRRRPAPTATTPTSAPIARPRRRTSPGCCRA